MGRLGWRERFSEASCNRTYVLITLVRGLPSAPRTPVRADESASGRPLQVVSPPPAHYLMLVWLREATFRVPLPSY